MNPLLVTETDGTEVLPSDGLISLEEGRRYQVSLLQPFGDSELWWGDVRLRREASGHFPLSTGFAVGHSSLRVVRGGSSQVLPLRIVPAREKLPETVWLAMLQDLEAWLPGVSVGVEAPRQGSVGRVGLPAPLIAEALTPLIPLLERSLSAMLGQPRQATRSAWEDVPLRATRRVNSESLVHLCRHPETRPWLNPWQAIELSGPEPSLPQRLAEETLDHPANRYLAWLISKVLETLDRTAENLGRLGGSAGDDEGREWCTTRADRMRSSAERVRGRYLRSFLARVPRAPATEAALLVVMDDPLYARVHNLGRVFLSPLFDLEDGSDTPAAVRPSFALYEFWCFLAVGRLLRSSLPAWNWREAGVSNLLSLSGTGNGAECVADRADGGRLRVEFNPVFSGYLNRQQKPRWSLSGERRPDLVVSWAPPGELGRWLCLDAKYRSGAQNLADAFSSVHIYRDSLRYEGYGGPCAGAMLLAPGEGDRTLPWFSDAFREEHGCGICFLRPGTTTTNGLAGWILKSLGLVND